MLVLRPLLQVPVLERHRTALARHVFPYQPAQHLVSVTMPARRRMKISSGLSGKSAQASAAPDSVINKVAARETINFGMTPAHLVDALVGSVTRLTHQAQHCGLSP